MISRLTGVELYSALSLKIRTGRLTTAETSLLRTRFLSDVATGVIAVVAVNESHYSTAENLIVQHAGRIGLRTLDALQLAAGAGIQKRKAPNGKRRAEGEACLWACLLPPASCRRAAALSSA